ncbi:outer dynein arm-docking complex subunit 1-like [Neosynchiropus ocellatus]
MNPDLKVTGPRAKNTSVNPPSLESQGPTEFVLQPVRRSDSSKEELDEYETKTAKLQKEFRVMKREQQSYSIHIREQIFKLEQEIKMLQKEQHRLKEILDASRALTKQKLDTRTIERLQAVLDDMEKEKKCEDELKREVTVMELKLLKQKKGEKIPLGGTENERHKILRKAEERLHRALTKLHKQQMTNNNLKAELQNLLFERGHRQYVGNSLYKEFKDVKKQTSQTMKLSIAAYDAREVAQYELLMLRERAETEVAKYNAKLRKAQAITHDIKLKEFEFKKKLRHKMEDTKASALREQELIAEAKLLESLEEAFANVKTVTGEESQDTLANRFFLNRDWILEVGYHVGVIRAEIQVVEEQISELQTEMETFYESSLQSDQSYKQRVEDIDTEIQVTKTKADEVEEETNIYTYLLNRIITELNNTLANVDCNHEVLEDRLGFSAGITENNIMSYLSLVEQKADEMLNIQAYLEFKRKDFDENRCL